MKPQVKNNYDNLIAARSNANYNFSGTESLVHFVNVPHRSCGLKMNAKNR